jgi:tRNA(Glu) U13 pseudouridine synthase TruD
VNSSIRYEIEDDSTVSFSFYLPKGTYATSLLREFMKSDNLRAYG